MTHIITTKCCCCSTRAGCIVIGAFELVMGSLIVAIICYKPDKEQSKLEEFPASAIFVLILNILLFLAVFLLYYAVIKGKHLFLLPWLILTVVTSVATIISITVESFFNYRTRDVVITTVDIMFQIYFFVIVYSHYHILKEVQETSGPPTLHTI